MKKPVKCGEDFLRDDQWRPVNTTTDVWYFLNNVKVQAAERLPVECWPDVKVECDDLFRQASGGKYQICPGWYIGGL